MKNNYNELVKKYNQSGPRYTSYPPATFFNEGYSNNDYLDEYNDKINQIQSILPNIDKLAIYEALTVCDFNIENSINYLYEYNITIV